LQVREPTPAKTRAGWEAQARPSKFIRSDRNGTKTLKVVVKYGTELFAATLSVKRGGEIEMPHDRMIAAGLRVHKEVFLEGVRCLRPAMLDAPGRETPSKRTASARPAKRRPTPPQRRRG
jgi:hypothetical protein